MSVYACTDLHGDEKILDKILDKLQEEDKLIFCGDAIDRGYHSMEVVEKLYNDPRVTYLKGNHEDMAAFALEDYIQDSNLEFGSNFKLWIQNGGNFTFNQFIQNHNKNLQYWLDIFKSLIDRVSFVNKQGQTIICDHSGFTPGAASELYWDRDHFFSPWPPNEEYANIIIVHGHTPVQFLGTRMAYIDNNNKLVYGDLSNPDKREAKALRYCGSHKINIDLGTIFTGTTALLNLDTLEIEYIKEKD